MKKIILMLLAVWTGNLFSQTPPPELPVTRMVDKAEAGTNPTIIPYEKWKLPNGLTVIIHEDHSDPVVHVRVSYHVGSARESILKSGFAHFFEHMMFQGSENVKDEEHFKIVSESGGNMNGFTERDMTTYFETLPSNQLETALWLESDRMGFLIDSLTSKKFENQRDAVKNEKSQNVENAPYAMAFVEYINQILYPLSHPYSWPVIGYVDDLNRVTLEDVKNFFLRWYGPNNAVLTIAGDVTSKEVMPLVEKYFGNIPAGPEVKKQKTQVPILATDQYFNYTDNTYFPLTLMVFPGMPGNHKDEAPMDLLTMMMGEGNNSIFYKNFVKSEKAVEASVSNTCDELSGEIQIVVVPYPPTDPSKIGATFNETEKLIRSTIDEFETTGITDESLNRAKAIMESRMLDNLSSVWSKAGLLSSWEVMLGKPYNLDKEIDRYNKVTKEDLVRVFQKYLKGKNAAFVNVHPRDPMAKDSVKSVNPYATAGLKSTNDAEYAGLKYNKAKDNFSRAKHPVPGPPKLVEAPKYFNKTMNNGLKVIGTQNNESPKVVLLLEMEGGRSHFAADPKKGDIAVVTAAMMTEGTSRLTTEQFSAELEKLGSTMSFWADNEETGAYITAKRSNLSATVELLKEVLLTPRFDEADFKRLRKQLAEDQSNQKRNASIAASKYFNAIIYGATVPGTYSTFKTISSVTLQDIKDYHKNFYSPSIGNLVVVGDVSDAEVLNILAPLENWKGKAVTVPVISGFPEKAPTQIYLIHKEGAAQSVISMGHISRPWDATGDFFKAYAMNFVLGGSFNSRINLNLREEKGYTYGSRTGISGTKIPGVFMAFASVRTNATDSAISEIMKEIVGYIRSGPKPDEIEYTKSSLLNSEAIKYETPQQKAGFLSRISEYGLSRDYTSKQNEVLRAMTKADFVSAIQNTLHPDKMAIVVVGNKWLVKKPLESLGLGKVKEVSLD